MAWFKKKPSDLERLAGLADEVRDTAIRRFAERGLAVTVLAGTSGLDTVLVAGDKRRFPLYNLTTNALAGRLEDVQRMVRSHVDGMVDAGRPRTRWGSATPSGSIWCESGWYRSKPPRFWGPSTRGGSPRTSP